MRAPWKKRDETGVDSAALRAIPRTGWETLLEALALAGAVVCLGVVARAWPQLPMTVPSHFGPSGTPDAWGPRDSLLILPAVGLGVYLALTVAARFPKAMNYPVRITPENVSKQYALARSLLTALKVEIVWLMAYLAWQTMQVARGLSNGLGEEFVPGSLVVIFGTIIVYFVQAFRAR